MERRGQSVSMQFVRMNAEYMFMGKQSKSKQDMEESTMIHEMKLWHESFVKIKEQTKTIEMRLFDEKRSSISVGDTIIFTDISDNEKTECLVINIYRYPSFEELYHQHDKVSIGYNEGETANPKDMLAYYSKEMIKQYGVVAIEIQDR